MLKFKRIYLRVCVVLAIILGIVFTFVDAVTFDEFIAKVNNPPESEDYELLKDYAMNYAKTFDKNSIDNEEIDISHNIEGNMLTITVNEFRCGIKAKFPIEFKSTGMENEKILTVLLHDVEYIEYSNLSSLSHYIAAAILLFCIISIAAFLITYCPALLIIWIIEVSIKKYNNKISTNSDHKE